MKPHSSAPNAPIDRFTGIRAVSFDVGGTLLEPWPSVGHVYAEVARAHGVAQATARVLNQRFRQAWKRRPQPHHTRVQWQGLVDEVFAGLAGPLPSQVFFAELYDRFSRTVSWRVFPDVLPTLDFLQSRRLPLAIISNWDERLRPLLEALGLSRRFSTLVISCEVGAAKPSPVIFREAARRLRLPPKAILHVGDSEQDDLMGARAAGFRALQIARTRPGRRRGRIRSLADLKRVLRD